MRFKKLREVVCLVLELKEEKRTFVKVGEEKWTSNGLNISAVFYLAPYHPMMSAFTSNIWPQKICRMLTALNADEQRPRENNRI